MELLFLGHSMGAHILVVQGLVAAILVLGLAMHWAAVGLIGLMVIVLLTAFNGVVEEHQLGDGHFVIPIDEFSEFEIDAMDVLTREEFRNSCDAVFARLDEQRQQRNAETRARAEQAGVPVQTDPPTARSIHALVEIGQEIRPEHYQAVATAIIFADEMRRKARERML